MIADRRIDAFVELTGPDQTRAVLVVEAKRSVVTRDLSGVLEQVQSHIHHYAGAAAPLLAARYLPPSARAWLEERGVSYVDATGNLRVVLERPALFLRDVGADRDPWRGPGRPRGTLQGPPAARVVRALVDFAPPISVPELARRSGASTGATYRVVEFLEREALIERTPRGPISAARWRGLIERWSEDYGFQRSNTVSAYLQPRGLSAVLDSLTASQELRYVISGSLAAYTYAPYAPPRLAMIYVDDPDRVAERLGLRSVDSGANTLLATGDYGVVFDRPVETGGLRFVAPSQAAVDLLTGPGRSPAEAHALLDWMEKHESDWRRRPSDRRT
ncbi:hypothetical protein GCM10029978_014320 [Actinoallomurus acanthiterrae]